MKPQSDLYITSGLMTGRKSTSLKERMRREMEATKKEIPARLPRGLGQTTEIPEEPNLEDVPF